MHILGLFENVTHLAENMFVLLIMERYCTLNSYLSIVNKINTHETNNDSSITTRLQV